MNEYILFMHANEADANRHSPNAWATYFARLRAVGAFDGGSAIGDGSCESKSAAATDITRHIVGYIRVRAATLDAARALVIGNPVYEAGGTVEIRELPRTA